MYKGAETGTHPPSEGGMTRLETLLELKIIDSSFSSSSLSIRAFRAYPLVETRQTGHAPTSSQWPETGKRKRVTRRADGKLTES